jgi:hypothetical protein
MVSAKLPSNTSLTEEAFEVLLARLARDLHSGIANDTADSFDSSGTPVWTITGMEQIKGTNKHVVMTLSVFPSGGPSNEAIHAAVSNISFKTDDPGKEVSHFRWIVIDFLPSEESDEESEIRFERVYEQDC